ncbi:MAG: MotA/TolQ/ExbB proton channel family protein [bacterium]|nr:MotA/TolQ/ExbB proton channel family protein [bacterium]
MLDFVMRGGFFMYPIIACSIVVGAIVLERMFHLKRAHINKEPFFEAIKRAIQSGDFDAASGLAARSAGPVAHIVKKCIEAKNRSKETQEKIIHLEGTKELRRMEKHLRALSLIAHISPLLGLLGTVTGMIKAFMKIQELSGNVDASVLAGGIWEALMTTAASLVAAIPAMIFYHHFEGKIDTAAAHMKEAASTVLEWCKEYRKTGIEQISNPIAVSIQNKKNKVETHGL